MDSENIIASIVAGSPLTREELLETIPVPQDSPLRAIGETITRGVCVLFGDFSGSLMQTTKSKAGLISLSFFQPIDVGIIDGYWRNKDSHDLMVVFPDSTTYTLKDCSVYDIETIFCEPWLRVTFCF